MRAPPPPPGLWVALARGGGHVAATVVLHGHYLVWSALEPQDTRAVYQYATRCLLPAVAPAVEGKGRRGGKVGMCNRL